MLQPLEPAFVVDAEALNSLLFRKKPFNVVLTLSTIRATLTSLKARRWLLFRPRQMDMRCHLSILPIILSSNGYVKLLRSLNFVDLTASM